MITLSLVGMLLILACRVETSIAWFCEPSPYAATQMDAWRRTSRGWEKNTRWKSANRRLPVAAAIHPALLAWFQVLACVGGMIAVGPNRGESSVGLGTVAEEYKPIRWLE